MAWIFQGNPERFDLEDYLARYPELIYWRAPKFQTQIAVGDTAFIWRAGIDAGVVAIGVIVEQPSPPSTLKHPEALGDDLWHKDPPNDEEPKVGIKLLDVRLTPSEGMVTRSDVKGRPELAESAIIKMPNATVFRLDHLQTQALEHMWGSFSHSTSTAAEFSANEGRTQLRSHLRRERSPFLAKKKISAFIAQHGSLHCEICGTTGSSYPSTFAPRPFEVHHIAPLAAASTPIRTTLADLAVLCANCHRVVHASKDVEANSFAVCPFRQTNLTMRSSGPCGRKFPVQSCVAARTAA